LRLPYRAVGAGRQCASNDCSSERWESWLGRFVPDGLHGEDNMEPLAGLGR